MFEKRFRKLELLRQEMNPPLQYGLENADHTILCWGSTQGAIQEAVDHLNLVGGDSWNMLSFADLFPLPYKKIQPLLTDIKHSIMYEVNWTGQLENLIHHHLDWRADNRIHPLSGETPTSSSIINEIKECFDFL
jgi:2-oxoglutarate ferredoxin oxidoreductase subunit alpha